MDIEALGSQASFSLSKMTFEKAQQLDKGRISRVTEFFASFCERKVYERNLLIHQSLTWEDVAAIRRYALVQTVIVQHDA